MNHRLVVTGNPSRACSSFGGISEACGRGIHPRRCTVKRMLHDRLEEELQFFVWTELGTALNFCSPVCIVQFFFSAIPMPCHNEICSPGVFLNAWLCVKHRAQVQNLTGKVQYPPLPYHGSSTYQVKKKVQPTTRTLSLIHI